ncbi:Uncharacterised protein [Streptococcus pneumoniae]|nr:Uncharacterised protein [Streptococcus pneumoniae]COF82698.1 Uncharacterised protein [Streptococcus pneumoniae]
MIVLISSFLKISASFAFSVLITLPRNGNTAWKRRSRPCFAEPPAESPSTRYSSFFCGLRDCAGVNFPLNVPSDFFFFLPLRASSLALRAASRACAALIAFLTRSVATSGFSSKKYAKCSDTMASIEERASLVPSFPFVCPSN